ncbi:MAG TPA: tetratricopeptide repeat protein [Terracidiphilus sp.]
MRTLPILAAILLTVALPGVLRSQSAAGADDGFSLLRAGKPEQAREVFEAVLAKDPASTAAQSGEVQASEQLALQYRAAANRDEALRTLLRAKDHVTGSPRLYYDLGILEDEMRLFHDADESLAHAAESMGNDPNLLYAIARVKMDLGLLGPAEEEMQAYLKLRPEDASAHYGLGRIYQIALQFDKARSEFARSIELKPVQTEAYYELGDIALKQGQFQDALVQFGKTLERDPRHGGALEGAGETNYKLKRYDDARQYLERAVDAAPGYPPCHYYLGLTLARLGQKEASQRELETASKMSEQQNAAAPLRLQQSTAPPKR